MNQQQQPGAVRASGRALDIEVCRRVFGHDIKPEWESWLPGIPPYSTDISAAMTVFEAAVEMTGVGSINADMEDARGEGFVVRVRFGFDGACATGPLSEAICRAALAAAGREQAGDE